MSLLDSVGTVEQTPDGAEPSEAVQQLLRRADRLRESLSDRQWATVEKLVSDAETEEQIRVANQTLDMLAPYEPEPEPPPPPPETYDKSLTPVGKLPKIGGKLIDVMIASGFPTAAEVVAAIRGDVAPLLKVKGFGKGKLNAIKAWADENMPITEDDAEPCAWCEDSGEPCACNDGGAPESDSQAEQAQGAPESPAETQAAAEGKSETMTVISETVGEPVIDPFLERRKGPEPKCKFCADTGIYDPGPDGMSSVCEECDAYDKTKRARRFTDEDKAAAKAAQEEAAAKAPESDSQTEQPEPEPDTGAEPSESSEPVSGAAAVEPEPEPEPTPKAIVDTGEQADALASLVDRLRTGTEWICPGCGKRFDGVPQPDAPSATVQVSCTECGTFCSPAHVLEVERLRSQPAAERIRELESQVRGLAQKMRELLQRRDPAEDGLTLLVDCMPTKWPGVVLTIESLIGLVVQNNPDRFDVDQIAHVSKTPFPLVLRMLEEWRELNEREKASVVVVVDSRAPFATEFMQAAVLRAVRIVRGL